MQQSKVTFDFSFFLCTNFNLNTFCTYWQSTFLPAKDSWSVVLEWSIRSSATFKEHFSVDLSVDRFIFFFTNSLSGNFVKFFFLWRKLFLFKRFSFYSIRLTSWTWQFHFIEKRMCNIKVEHTTDLVQFIFYQLQSFQYFLI